MMMQFTATNTLIQSMVPGPIARARDVALYSMMFLGMSPIGSLAGWDARGSHWRARDRGDWRAVQVACGGLVFLRKWPDLRGPARES